MRSVFAPQMPVLQKLIDDALDENRVEEVCRNACELVTEALCSVFHREMSSESYDLIKIELAHALVRAKCIALLSSFFPSLLVAMGYAVQKSVNDIVDICLSDVSNKMHETKLLEQSISNLLDLIQELLDTYPQEVRPICAEYDIPVHQNRVDGEMLRRRVFIASNAA